MALHLSVYCGSLPARLWRSFTSLASTPSPVSSYDSRYLPEKTNAGNLRPRSSQQFLCSSSVRKLSYVHLCPVYLHLPHYHTELLFYTSTSCGGPGELTLHCGIPPHFYFGGSICRTCSGILFWSEMLNVSWKAWIFLILSTFSPFFDTNSYWKRNPKFLRNQDTSEE